MQKHRIISLASILAMVLIPVIGWFLIAQPQFAAAALADTARAEADSQAAATMAAVAELKAQAEDLPALTGTLDELRGSLPAEVDSSAYIDGLNALAIATGVQITALSVDNPAAYTPAVAVVDPAAAAPAEEEGDAAAATDAAAAAPIAPSDPAIVTNPLITSANFVAIPVAVELVGGYDSILNFVQGLQTGSRLFLVSKIETDVDPLTGGYSARVGGFIYAVTDGLVGDPTPVSTQVKIMDTPVVAPVETDAPEDEDGATPSPTPTGTPTP